MHCQIMTVFWTISALLNRQREKAIRDYPNFLVVLAYVLFSPTLLARTYVDYNDFHTWLTGELSKGHPLNAQATQPILTNNKLPLQKVLYGLKFLV